MRLIAPFGFYGWGNIGDEATLQGFARLVARCDPSGTKWIGSRDPEHTAKAEPAFRYFKAQESGLRRWWANRRAQGAVFVGGTPIMDILGRWPLSEVVPLAIGQARRRTPVAFVGIGTERLHREESRRFITTELVPRVRHWSVRSPRDRDRLLACGVEDRRVTVAADLAWTLDASVDGDRQAPACLLPRAGELIVGVNVTNEQFVADRAPRIFEVLAQLLDRLVERFGARVVFFCNEIREEESFDKAASGRVIAQMRRPERAAILPNDYRTPGQMMGLIGKCHLAIGMRYHFCLFAAIQGVPFIAIKRSDKVVDLCEDLSWTYGVGLDQLEALHLEELAAELLSDPPRATSALRDRVAPMRERVWLNRVSLDALRREEA